jgi:hypothetical protein
VRTPERGFHGRVRTVRDRALDAHESAQFGTFAGIGFVAMTVAAMITAVATEPGSSARLLMMATAVALFAAVAPRAAASATTALVGFLMYLGFLVNEEGELAWHGGQTWRQLAVFGLALLVGLGRRWFAKPDLRAHQPK